MHFFGAIWNIKFSAYLASKFKKEYAETEPSDSNIWDEFSKQQKQKKNHF